MLHHAANPDPLRVLGSTAPIIDHARHVRIDPGAIAVVAAGIASRGDDPPGWEAGLHWSDGTWRTAGWMLAMDALNFCFWSDDPAGRWTVIYDDVRHDGYWALVAALRRATDEGFPLWDAAALAALTPGGVAQMLRPTDPGTPEIPLLPERAANLRELGAGLLQLEAEVPGQPGVVTLLERAGGSAVALVEEVVSRFPSFRDELTWAGSTVRFLKRAQILVADLHGAFGGEGLGRFDDLAALTAFADYKVPQVLRRLGVLAYDEHLAALLREKVLLAPGCREEVEIRAATLHACEAIRQELLRLGRLLHACEIDWALWLAGQDLPPGTEPYHRTLTIFY